MATFSFSMLQPSMTAPSAGGGQFQLSQNYQAWNPTQQLVPAAQGAASGSESPFRELSSSAFVPGPLTPPPSSSAPGPVMPPPSSSPAPAPPAAPFVPAGSPAFVPLSSPQQSRAPRFGVMQYPNEVYRQLPAFKLLLGEISPEQYYTLTGRSSVIPALGNLEVPGPRQLTWRMYSQLLANPVGLDVLRSLWQAANRDLDAEAVLARSYAPLGNAVEPTLIRYG